MTGATPELYRENMVALAAMDALIGALTSNVRALFLEFQGEQSVIAHFVLRQPSPEDEEEIRDEFPGELAALTYNVPGVGLADATPVIHYDGDEASPTPPGVCVFSFKKSQSGAP